MTSEPHRHALLFGAGASEDAKLPTSRQLTARVLEVFTGDEQDPQQAILRYVVGGLQFQRGIARENPLTATVDIESVVRAIELLEEREQSEVAPFVGSWHPQVTELARGRPREYAITNERILKTLCDVLWHVDAGRTAYLSPLKDLLARQTLLDIVTLNFDNVVETFANGNGVSCSTGLVSRFDPKRGYEIEFAETGINLYKLHGSLNWVLHDAREAENASGRVPQRFVLAHPDVYGPHITHARPAILLGANKLTSEGPYLQLLQHVESALRRANILTIVGYSFRDEHVNNQIAGFMNRKRDNRLQVIDPEPPIGHGFLKTVREACADRLRIEQKKAAIGLQTLLGSS